VRVWSVIARVGLGEALLHRAGPDDTPRARDELEAARPSAVEIGMPWWDQRCITRPSNLDARVRALHSAQRVHN
jgi:hypothetical protein